MQAKRNNLVREEIDRMLRDRLIRPKKPPWGFPVLIVSKKDGEPLFCFDYCALNKVMKGD